MRFVTADRFCRKPCCEFELINFTDKINLFKKIFSKTFEITVSRLIGGNLRQLVCLSL